MGYADNQQVAAGSKYANNMELSIARAQAAADFARAPHGYGRRPGVHRRPRQQRRRPERPPHRHQGGLRRWRSRPPPMPAASRMWSMPRSRACPGGRAGCQGPERRGRGRRCRPDESKLADTFEVDPKWLQTQADGTPQFVWPTQDYLPAVPAIRVAVEHGAQARRPCLTVNGETGVQPQLPERAEEQPSRPPRSSAWIGVPLQGRRQRPGGDGHRSTAHVVQRLERQIHYSGTPVRAEFVPEKSTPGGGWPHQAGVRHALLRPLGLSGPPRPASVITRSMHRSGLPERGRAAAGPALGPGAARAHLRDRRGRHRLHQARSHHRHRRGDGDRAAAAGYLPAAARLDASGGARLDPGGRGQRHRGLRQDQEQHAVAAGRRPQQRHLSGRPRGVLRQGHHPRRLPADHFI